MLLDDKSHESAAFFIYIQRLASCSARESAVHYVQSTENDPVFQATLPETVLDSFSWPVKHVTLSRAPEL